MNANVVFAGFCAYRATHAIYAHYQMDAAYQQEQNRLDQEYRNTVSDGADYLEDAKEGGGSIHALLEHAQNTTTAHRASLHYQSNKPSSDWLFKELFTHAVLFFLQITRIEPWSKIVYGALDLTSSYSIYTKIKTVDKPLMIRIAMDVISISYGIYGVCKK